MVTYTEILYRYFTSGQAILFSCFVFKKGNVVDPDPHGSGTFARIRIRNSENSKLDPDPE